MDSRFRGNDIIIAWYRYNIRLPYCERTAFKEIRMSNKVTIESFDSFTDYWRKPEAGFHWNSVFVLPVWLHTWWEAFQGNAKPLLCSVRDNGTTIGLAALQVENGTASFLGGEDICDYLDFITIPGKERVFFETLLDGLVREGIASLALKCLRPESTVLGHLVEISGNRGYDVSCAPNGVSLELDLPENWDDYLAGLKSKQRHEIRRKLRRLEEAGEVKYHVVEESGELADYFPVFLDLFRKSRTDKSMFMTERMQSFFTSVSGVLAELNILKLGLLDLNRSPAAAVLYFDYGNTFYLYNNGYEPGLDSLSVGTLCKVYNIRDAIERGRRTYDFMRGSETYKYRLGGREIPLQSCRIDFRGPAG